MYKVEAVQSIMLEKKTIPLLFQGLFRNRRLPSGKQRTILRRARAGRRNSWRQLIHISRVCRRRSKANERRFPKVETDATRADGETPRDGLPSTCSVSRASFRRLLTKQLLLLLAAAVVRGLHGRGVVVAQHRVLHDARDLLRRRRRGRRGASRRRRPPTAADAWAKEREFRPAGDSAIRPLS